jgi:hypothetical protein
MYPPMTRRKLFLLVFAGCCPPEPAKKLAVVQAPAPQWRELAMPEEAHLANMHQLTYGADNAEAYWSFGGDRLIMQTNHAPYGCDQIEELDVAAAARAPVAAPGKLVSTGKGRTTCSYFLPGDKEIIYASTHAASPTCPTPPDMSKGYYWGLFDYDIYKANADGSNLRRMTDTPGYDAEATVCPIDGSIVFTSMRSGDLELWRMDADGGHLQQLTNTPGYDGGAVWSPDCTKIAWRASRPTGKDLDEYKELLARQLVKPTKMDLWVANADGTEARQITYLPGASFGPFFYPSGKRIIFSSNYLAPRGPEFDLFAIDTDGTHLERITFAPSFDGFPMFSPDGKRLAFSSNRRDVVPGRDGIELYRVTGGVAGAHDTNVYVAEWRDVEKPTYQPETASAERFADAVAYLAAPEREGRGIGTAGLRAAADYVQRELESAGAEVTRQSFDMTVAIERGGATKVEIDGKPLAADQFTPTAYSASKPAKGEVVAVGWGIVDADAKLDDYKGKNVRGKIALVHRFVPEAEKRDPQVASRLGDIRRKAAVARQHGAIGLVVVDDSDPKQDEAPLPRLARDGMAEVMTGGADEGIPIVVVKRAAFAGGAPKRAELAVALDFKRAPTDNVIGVIRGNKRAAGVIVVGAHLDHLGMGGGSNALDPEVHAVHGGADDNASGVAALLEVARSLAARKDKLDRDVYFVAFSGEEEGDIGSQYFVKHPPTPDPIVAMINMDMVGRMRGDALHVLGGDTAKEWHEIVEPACATARVACTVGGSGYGPSDHTPFYVANIPVLYLFTGNHLDYHTAHDTADKINAAGGARVAQIVADVTVAVAAHPSLSYVKKPPETAPGDVRRKGASLGTVPSYGEDPNQPPGLVLSDVIPDGPAAKAGLKGGDRIVAVGTVEIRNINDLMFVLETSKPGTATTITFVRDGKRQTANATFGAPRGRK